MTARQQAASFPPVAATRFAVRSFASIGSTSDEAKRLAIAGAPDGVAIMAREQTSGRGRLDRSWTSPPGNLYLSLLLRPTQAIAAVAQLGFVAALAVADAVSLLAPDISATIKWPNDVLISTRKLAGILLETRNTPAGGVEWLVVGIGVNVAVAPIETATSLQAEGIDVSPEQVGQGVLQAFAGWQDRWEAEGFGPIRQAWLARGHRPGDPLRVRRPDGDRFGTFRDLDADGVLLLDTPYGLLRVAAGDVHLAA